MATPAPIQIPITGKESISDPAAPLYALSQFYRAFNNRNLVLMQEVWERSPEASLHNPIGGIKRGWENIRPVYERIFQATVQVEFFDYTLHDAGELFFAVGRTRSFFLRRPISRTRHPDHAHFPFPERPLAPTPPPRLH